MTLTPKQRKELKAHAHHLQPVIRVGQKGITESLLQETHQALHAHELIKVHIAQDDRAQREAVARSICEQCHAELVASIGKIAILYRENHDIQAGH